jgi:hypothetical protein
VTPPRGTDPERTLYVEAATHQAAAKKIAGTISLLEYTKLFEAEEAVYNIASVFEPSQKGSAPTSRRGSSRDRRQRRCSIGGRGARVEAGASC